VENHNHESPPPLPPRRHPLSLIAFRVFASVHMPGQTMRKQFSLPALHAAKPRHKAGVEAIPQKDIAIAVVGGAALIAAILLQVRNFRNCLS
jgi:hypothetical protein